MGKRKAFYLLVFMAVAVLFAWGVIGLLMMRFEAGEAYPPYSSYRSNPLGARAFYEGLSLLPQVKTTRNIEPLSRLSGAFDTTLLLLGVDTGFLSSMDKETLRAMEDTAQAGGRIVVTFAPTAHSPPPIPPVDETAGKKEKETVEKKAGDAGKSKDDEDDPSRKAYVDLRKQWLVETGYSRNGAGEARLVTAGMSLPATLPWHSTFFFKPDYTVWRTIYGRADEALFIERSYGKGSIVLVSDSYFVSNEAMKRSRHADLLAWLCGNHRNIVFDETHLGITRKQGIATLIRRYGLAPFFLSLIGLALLAVWRQSTSLVPPGGEEERVGVDGGKDALTGFTNLVRRNISPQEILSACLSEWKRSFTHGAQDLSALLPDMEEIIAEEQAKPKRARDPVKTYRSLSMLRTKR